MKNLFFGFFLFLFCSVSFSKETQTYACSSVSADQSGNVGIVFSSANGTNRSYQVKYLKGKITEFGGVMADASVFKAYAQEAIKKSGTQNLDIGLIRTGIYAHLEGSKTQNSDLYQQASQGLMAMFMYQTHKKFQGIGFSGGGMGPAQGFIGGGSGTIVDPNAPRAYKETRPGAQMKTRGEGTIHPAGVSVGVETAYVETRAGAKIPVRGEAESSQREVEGLKTEIYDVLKRMSEYNQSAMVKDGPAPMPPDTRPGANVKPPAGALMKTGAGPSIVMGQLIGRDGVTTFSGSLSPLEEINKLSYREGLDHQMALPSGNQSRDMQDKNLLLVKSDLERLKKTVRCCISGSNRSCESKDMLTMDDAIQEMKNSNEDRPNSNTGRSSVPGGR